LLSVKNPHFISLRQKTSLLLKIERFQFILSICFCQNGLDIPCR